MTRLIDADELCEQFKKRQQAALRWKEKSILNGDEERSIRADATLAFLSEVKLTIDNAPTVEERPQGEWIPVSERLPEEYGTYLVTDEYGDVFEYDYSRLMISDGKWSYCRREIVAWMPLPKPYKMEADND